MGCATFVEEKYKDGFESLRRRLTSGKEIKRKLDMTMISRTYSNYEHRPQDYILDLITDDKQWSKMDLKVLGNFFLDINNLYYDAEDGVPYHNLSHGFDVTVVFDKFLMEYKMLDHLKITSYERICMLIAAYAHDNAHEGYTSYYYNSNNMELALKYAYNAPLENMHASNLMRIILRHQLPIPMQYKKMMVSMILGTDMGHHFDVVQQLSSDMHIYNNRQMKKTPRQFLINVLLHAADISNPAKPTKQHLVWNQKVKIQFTKQRNKQHELGTKPILKNEKPGVGQLKFINFIVYPLYEQLVILNPLMQPLLDQVKVNKEHWKNVCQGNDNN